MKLQTQLTITYTVSIYAGVSKFNTVLHIIGVVCFEGHLGKVGNIPIPIHIYLPYCFMNLLPVLWAVLFLFYTAAH